MADAPTLDSLLSAHKLLDPDGPVCLIVRATMGVTGDLDRFQPAGFPEIGHVIYKAPRGDSTEDVCIVDSPASMANHLEQVCLAGGNDSALHDDLTGLPHVKCVTDRDPTVSGNTVTPKPDGLRDVVVATTLTEGHRLASDYFLDSHRIGGDGKPVEAVFRDELRREFGIIPVKDETFFITPEAWWTIYTTLFKYDPNSLVHGVLFAAEQIKISRLLTAHLEAFGASRVGSSGVKFDPLKKTRSGQPIFAVDQETAREIRATFIIDLAMLRSYGRDARPGREAAGLTRPQKALLLALSLWKINALVRRTFSYRSGCKLKMQSVAVRTDDQSAGDDPVATQLPVIDMAGLIGAAYPAGGERGAAVYYSYKELFRAEKKKKPTGASDEGGDEGEGGD